MDYLIIDLPPGTGDIALSLAQKAPLSGAVVVSTPQDVALLDARRGWAMFDKLNLHVLGLVQNMALYCCPQCGHAEDLFGSDGVVRLAEETGTRFLGSLPLNKAIRVGSDSGHPVVKEAPESAAALAYRALAHQVSAALALRPKSYRTVIPPIQSAGVTS